MAPEIGVVLIALEQVRTRPDRAHRHRLRGVSRSPPVEARLARHHAPERILRGVAEVPVELALIHDRLAEVGVELEAGKMLRDQLVEGFGGRLPAEAPGRGPERYRDALEHFHVCDPGVDAGVSGGAATR